MGRHLTNGGKAIESCAGENPGGWKNAMKGMALQARGTGGVDDTSVTVFDISNADRMGKTDVTLVNICIDGIAFLTVAEHALRKDYDGNKAHVDAALTLGQTPVEGKDGNAQLVAARDALLEKIPTLKDDFCEATPLADLGSKPAGEIKPAEESKPAAEGSGYTGC